LGVTLTYANNMSYRDLRGSSRWIFFSYMKHCATKCQWRSKALKGPGSTVTWQPSLSLPSTFPPSPSPFPSSSPAQPLPYREAAPQIWDLGERCNLPQRGLGRSPSRNRIWCILALKSVIWWQQF